MPESVVSPFDLHEGFPWANTAILASVPPRAGQYRFVRIIPVLIFPGARSCVGFVLPKARPAQSPGTNPQRIPVTEIPVIFAACDRRKAGPSLPASGLHLVSVEY